MCGLVGMAGDLAYKHKQVFKGLLFFNTLRGADSTGVSVYNADKNTVATHKSTVPGFEYIQQADFDVFLGQPAGVWLGHGRYKTVGQINRANAHPFEVRDDEGCITLFGAHNGTLSNKWDIEKQLDGPTFGTDSEALLNLINNVGAKAALKEARGAWALTYWHYDKSTINLIRNDQRPLYYALTEDEKVLMWASEPWMIRIACMREDLPLLKDKDGVEIVHGLVPDALYSWELPEFKAHLRDKFDPPVVKGGLFGKPEEKRFPLAPSEWFGADYDDEGDLILASITDTTKKVEKAQQGEASNVVPIKADQVRGYKGKAVNRQYVEEMRRMGCDMCGDPLSEDGFAWMDEYSLACANCIKGTHVVVDVESRQIRDNIIILEPVQQKRGSKR